MFGFGRRARKGSKFGVFTLFGSNLMGVQTVEYNQSDRWAGLDCTPAVLHLTVCLYACMSVCLYACMTVLCASLYSSVLLCTSLYCYVQLFTVHTTVHSTVCTLYMYVS